MSTSTSTTVPAEPEEKLIPISIVANRLGSSVSTVKRIAELTPVRVGRRLLYSASSVAEYIEALKAINEIE